MPCSLFPRLISSASKIQFANRSSAYNIHTYSAQYPHYESRMAEAAERKRKKEKKTSGRSIVTVSLTARIYLGGYRVHSRDIAPMVSLSLSLSLNKKYIALTYVIDARARWAVHWFALFFPSRRDLRALCTRCSLLHCRSLFCDEAFFSTSGRVE